MACPLYTGARVPRTRPAEANVGLWFDKFCNTWRHDGQNWTLSADHERRNPKLEWLDSVKGAVGKREHIREFVDRRLRLVQHCGGRFAVYRTVERFVTGLGRAHPVENGFAWHHTLGTPYLPGSSIKGLVRAWAEDPTGGEGRRAKEAVEAVFGQRGACGCVSFLDAIPFEPVTLEADVMTPHYAGWSENDPPGDWRSPTPIPFLVTKAGARFLFAVVPLCEAGLANLDRVMTWLEQALEHSGAGAKSAIGYGRMVRDEQAEQRLHRQWSRRQEEAEARLREQQRRAELDPLDRELLDIAQQPQYRDKPDYTAWLNELKQGRWSDQPEKQRAVAERIRSRMQSLGKWKPQTNARNPDKDTAYQRTQAVLSFLS